MHNDAIWLAAIAPDEQDAQAVETFTRITDDLDVLV